MTYENVNIMADKYAKIMFNIMTIVCNVHA